MEAHERGMKDLLRGGIATVVSGLLGEKREGRVLSDRDFTNGGESSRSGRERDFIKGRDYETIVRKLSQVLNRGSTRSRSP